MLSRRKKGDKKGDSCRNMSHHELMGSAAARLETMALVKQKYVLI